MHPTLFTLEFGSTQIPLNTFGLCGALGILFGSWLATFLAKKNGFGADEALDVVLVQIAGTVIGSKALQLVAEWDHYQHNPASIFSLREIGVFYGGLIGAAVFVVIRCRMKGWDPWKAGDVLVPAFALAHGFARLGCHMAGCCYGKPTDHGWGVHFPPESVAYKTLIRIDPNLIQDGHTVGLIPTQITEALFEFSMAGVLVALFFFALRSDKLRSGWMVIFWVTPYALFRFAIETVRFDPERGTVFGLLSTSQFIGIVLLVLCAVGARHLLTHPEEASPPPSDDDNA